MAIRIAIVVAEFNYDTTYLVLQCAINHAKLLGAEVTYIVKALGSYETPLAVKSVLKRKGEVDGVVALGAVIQEETKHDEVVAHNVGKKTMDLTVEYGKHVGLEVIGPGASRARALKRIDDYARRAVEAVVKMAKGLLTLEQSTCFSGTIAID